jgi:hypothetical protein
MASPTTSADPTPPGPAGVYNQDLDADSSSSYVESEGGSASHRQQTLCPWRTVDHHQQECSRYLDCPSHTLERTASEPNTDDPPRRRSDVYGMTDHEASGSERPVPTARSNSLPEIADSGAWPEAAEEAPIGISIPVGSTSMPQLEETEENTTDESEEELERALRHPPLHTFSETQYHSPHRLARHVSNPGEQRIASPSPQSQVYYPSQRPESSFPYIYGMHEPAHGFQRPRTSRRPDSSRRRSSDISLPRWQPDVEVTYCPICQTQFSIFVRKHHCR